MIHHIGDLPPDSLLLAAYALCSVGVAALAVALWRRVRS